MLKYFIIFLLIALVAVNANIRARRQFGLGEYNRGGAPFRPSYRPLANEAFGGRRFHGNPRGKTTVITTEVIRGK